MKRFLQKFKINLMLFNQHKKENLFQKFFSRCTVVQNRFFKTPQFLVQEQGLVSLPVTAEARMGNQVGAGAQTLEVLIDRIRIA